MVSKYLNGINQGNVLRFEMKIDASTRNQQEYGHEFLFVNKKTKNIFSTGLIKWVSQARVKILIVQGRALTKNTGKWFVILEYMLNIDSTKSKSGGKSWSHKTKQAAVKQASRMRTALKKKQSFASIESYLRKKG